MSLQPRWSGDDVLSFCLRIAFSGVVGGWGLWRAWEGWRYGNLLVYTRRGNASVAYAAGSSAGAYWFELVLMGGLGLFFTTVFCAMVLVGGFGSPARKASMRRWLSSDQDRFWRMPRWVLLLAAAVIALFFKYFARA
ncbi:hypothetical protein [Ralstonia pseudosolanacearum]